MSDQEFAARSRQRCAPAECDQREGCWMKTARVSQGTLRCAACEGLVRTENWVPPTAVSAR